MGLRTQPAPERAALEPGTGSGHTSSMNKTALSLVASLLSFVPALAAAQVAEQTYDIRDGCKVTARLLAPADAPAELDLRVDDASNPQTGFGRFRKLVRDADGVLMPMGGFNLCESYDYGPVSVTVESAGDYQRISMRCGGTWEPVQGEASLTLHRASGKVVQARVKLDGAYSNGSLHSGIIKKPIESFSCQGADYAAAAAALDGGATKTVRGTLQRGRFTAAP